MTSPAGEGSGPPDTRPPGHPPPPPPPPFSGVRAATAMATPHADAGSSSLAGPDLSLAGPARRGSDGGEGGNFARALSLSLARRGR